jgi:SSS family transporter
MLSYNLRLIDGAIVIAYLLVTGIISYYVGRRQKDKEAYLMAGRKMHWFPVALSSVAAGFSAISILGAPGYVMAEDMRYLPSLFVGILSIPVVYYIVLPFLYKLKMVSVYEYLEIRFSTGLRLFGSVLFMLTKLGYLSMIIFAPCLALSAMTGLPLGLLIAIFGLMTTIYTVVGGLEGVIWTELIQYFVLVAGILAVVFYFVFAPTAGHVSQYWAIATQAGKTRMFDFSFGLDNLSMWVLTLSITLLGVAGMCSDQTSIQRFFAARSIKHAIKGYIFSMIFGTPIVLTLYFIGAWMFGFFHSEQLLPAELASQPDSVFPYFIANYLPFGAAGLMLAVIVGTGISTVGAVIHSLNSLFMVDFYERFASNKEKGSHYVKVSRFVNFAWGILAIIAAFYVMKLGKSIMEVSGIVGGLFAGPLGGIYFLGIFTKRANNFGAIFGGIIGLVITIGTYLLDNFGIKEINFMWYGVFGIVTTFVVGYFSSFFCGAPPKEPSPQMPAEIAAPNYNSSPTKA